MTQPEFAELKSLIQLNAQGMRVGRCGQRGVRQPDVAGGGSEYSPWLMRRLGRFCVSIRR